MSGTLGSPTSTCDMGRARPGLIQRLDRWHVLASAAQQYGAALACLAAHKHVHASQARGAHLLEAAPE